MGFLGGILSDARLPLGGVGSNKESFPSDDLYSSVKMPAVAPHPDNARVVRHKAETPQPAAAGVDAVAIPTTVKGTTPISDVDTDVPSIPPPVAKADITDGMNPEPLLGRSPSVENRPPPAATQSAPSLNSLQEVVSEAGFSWTPQSQRPMEVSPHSDNTQEAQRKTEIPQSVTVGVDAVAMPTTVKGTTPISDIGVPSTPPPRAKTNPTDGMNAEPLSGRNPSVEDRSPAVASPPESGLPLLQAIVSDAGISWVPQPQQLMEVAAADGDPPMQSGQGEIAVRMASEVRESRVASTNDPMNGHHPRPLLDPKPMHTITQATGPDDASPRVPDVQDTWRITDPEGRTLQVRSRTLTAPVKTATQVDNRPARPASPTPAASTRDRVPVTPVARPGTQPVSQVGHAPAQASRAATNPDVRIGRIDVIIAPPAAPEPTATSTPGAKSGHGFASRHYLRGR